MSEKDELTQYLEDKGLQIGYEIDFPRYRKLPDEVRLALLILVNHGMNVIFTLVPKKLPTREIDK